MKDINNVRMYILVAPDGTPQPNTLAPDPVSLMAMLKLQAKSGLFEPPSVLFTRAFSIHPVTVSIKARTESDAEAGS